MNSGTFLFFLLLYYNILTAVRSCHSNQVVPVFMNWNVPAEFPFWGIQISVSANSLWGSGKGSRPLNPSWEGSDLPNRLKFTRS